MRVCSIKVSNFSFDAGQYMHMHQISVVLGSVYGPAMTHLIWQSLVIWSKAWT